MSRLPRLFAPAVVQHIVQRPLDGRQLFVDADDYALFVELIDEALRGHALSLHAYVLLPTQIRLLATPATTGAVASLIQSIGRRYVPHLNRKTARSGPLWDRRYRSTLIDADEYLLAAMRFIEQQPVADGFVATPEAWRWSSAAHHVGRDAQRFLTDHGHYWALSDAPFERQAAYRTLVDEPVDARIAGRIERSVERGWALGDDAFLERLGPLVNRRAQPLQRGRRRTIG